MAFKVGKHKKSSFNYNPAPLKINEEELIQKHLVSGILFNRKQAQISMMDIPHQPGIEGYILKAISDANILVDMITQTEKNSDTIDLTFTIPRMKCKKNTKSNSGALVSSCKCCCSFSSFAILSGNSVNSFCSLKLNLL